MLIEHIFSAYVIILLAGVLLFLYQPFGSFPQKRTDVKTEERGALYLDESRSGCGQGASFESRSGCGQGASIAIM